MPYEHYSLRNGCGPGGTGDAPLEDEDEECVEYGVDAHGGESGIHGALRTVGGAEHGVQPEIQVCDRVEGQQNEHVLVGVG